MKKNEMSFVAALQSRGSGGRLVNTAGWECRLGSFPVLGRGVDGVSSSAEF